MSKISLKPNASGTGVFSLEAPNSNVDRTLTLPDEAGSVLTDVSDIESQVKTATNATGSAPVYACRAWVNFDGRSTNIRESGNVSSITDNGVAEYTVNFTTAMPVTNYSAPISASYDTSGTLNTDDCDALVRTYTNSSCFVTGFRENKQTFTDFAIVSLAVFC